MVGVGGGHYMFPLFFLLPFFFPILYSICVGIVPGRQTCDMPLGGREGVSQCGEHYSQEEE